MILALFGFATIITFMVLVMTRILPAIAALILVPILFALLAGFGLDLSGMAVKGFTTVTPSVVSLAFAVLYFSLMTDTGLFDPVVRLAVRFGKGDPLRIALATVTVATVISLDGDGTTSAIVTLGAFLPIYRRTGMNPLILAVLLGSASAVINMTPWGGPAARAASALNVPMSEIFIPLLPVIVIGIIASFCVAVFLGLRERRRLGVVAYDAEFDAALFEREPGVERPKLIWLNLGLTILVMAAVLSQLVPLPLVFMVGVALALILNYPKLKSQQARLAAHAPNVAAIVLLIFSAGVFAGILQGTGMVEAMGKTFVALAPEGSGPHFGAIVALFTGPLTFVMTNDAYYFGILPVFAETASHFGVTHAEIARASLLGVTIHALSPLIAPIYLVAGMLKVEVGEMQKFGLPYAIFIYLVMVVVAFLLGVVPFYVAA